MGHISASRTEALHVLHCYQLLAAALFSLSALEFLASPAFLLSIPLEPAIRFSGIFSMQEYV